MEELHAPGLSHLKSEKGLFFHNKIIKKQIHSVVSLFYMYDSNEPKTPQLNSYEKMTPKLLKHKPMLCHLIKR
jgi:hypothetical protein